MLEKFLTLKAWLSKTNGGGLGMDTVYEDENTEDGVLEGVEPPVPGDRYIIVVDDIVYDTVAEIIDGVTCLIGPFDDFKEAPFNIYVINLEVKINFKDKSKDHKVKVSKPKKNDVSGITINNQNKTIVENGTYTADAGYTGLGVVTVDVPQTGGGSGGQLNNFLVMDAVRLSVEIEEQEET